MSKFMTDGGCEEYVVVGWTLLMLLVGEWSEEMEYDEQMPESESVWLELELFES